MSVLSCRNRSFGSHLPNILLSKGTWATEFKSQPHGCCSCRRQKSKCKPNVPVLPGNIALSGLGNWGCTDFPNGVEGKICWSDEWGYAECSHWAAEFQQTIKGWAKLPPVLQVFIACKHWWSENNKIIIIIKRCLCLLFHLVSFSEDSSGNQSLSP